MTDPDAPQTPVSVVVVSRDRPDLLMRTLKGLSQLFYRNFEVIVVADPAAITRVQEANLAVKCISFDVANISDARNHGIAAAAGAIIASIDDDAVPEPTWLDHLIPALAAPKVAAAGGFVRGRNGISFQWKAQWVDRDGAGHPLEMSGAGAQVFDGERGRGIKTEGTNCAFRAEVLRDLGGFDAAFRFYFDETDLNMRLADAGHKTAIVPLAQVHHGFAESARRTKTRVPRDLSEIGASTAVFLRKHNADVDMDLAFRTARAHQKNRLMGFVRRFKLARRDVAEIMNGFERGWRNGMARKLQQTRRFDEMDLDFLPFQTAAVSPQSILLTGRIWQRLTLESRAVELVNQGNSVTLMLFSASLRRHTIRFDPRGFWVHRGGIWGRAERTKSALHWCGFRGRCETEWGNVAKIRHNSPNSR